MGLLESLLKYLGYQKYQQTLLNAGIPLEEMALYANDIPIETPLRFFKSATSPQSATVYVDAPVSGTQWRIQGVCPITATAGKATVSGTLTGLEFGMEGFATVSGTLTPA